MPMQGDINPTILDKACLATLREAVRLAGEAAGAISEPERWHLASIVFSFYKRGLVDPRRLAEIAVLASSSRIFRSEYSVRDATVP
ncbi:hypothetical protein [Rhizobium halophilum]|uniref:hypothetical protein n=1 Tax=Rhizobium halophilum TaxID=2846852 RepID=UPI001EFEA328|nr:hypothetical protein [Rhizobium halophilum]MCF6370896.1 hypothetical protein [Rhizobium halophilum]